MEDFEAMEALHALKRAKEVKKNPELMRRAKKAANQKVEDLKDVFDERTSGQKKRDRQFAAAKRSMIKNGRK